jgi:hypothetical protein
VSSTNESFEETSHQSFILLLRSQRESCPVPIIQLLTHVTHSQQKSRQEIHRFLTPQGQFICPERAKDEGEYQQMIQILQIEE